MSASASSSQDATPWLSALEDVSAAVAAPFSFPGHAQGGGTMTTTTELARWLDLPELPGLDALDAPEGPLLEAQVYLVAC